MRKKALASINKESIKLLNKIEDYAQSEILFVDGEIDDPIHTYAKPEGGAIASTRITHNWAKIYLFDKQHFKYAIPHELLHVHRHWCEKVPQIEPIIGRSDNWDITGQIESVIEHLVLIPREPQYKLSNWKMWGQHAASYWDAFDKMHFGSPFDMKFKLLTAWLHTIESVSNHKAKQNANTCIKKVGLYKEAKQLQKLLLPLLNDGEKARIFLADYFRLDLNAYQIVTFDIQNKEKIINKFGLL